ncbi:IS4 family transposase [Jiangella alkaliphila]|uniref:IS4 family transposase n=1 Tax=Jiangella alkaliphila TaxID=419479 RepID=UPI00155FE76C|nr:IS4 family transposase [Jiangella alkaliphila]
MSLGALESDLCPELLDEVIEQAGVREQRRRLLPARTVMVFVLGLCVFCGADSHSPPGYRMVMCWLTSTFGYLRGLVVPSASALCQARKRLGVTPLRLLFDRVRGPRAAPDAAGAWLFGRRLVAFDGTALDLADTAANVAAFGHIGTPSGFAQVRLVALIECATHAIIDAVFDACRHSEQELTQRLIGAMRPGMLVLADRNFGHRLFAQIATSTGADLIWRIKGNADFPAMKILDDGSYLSVITAQRYKKRWRTAARRGWPEPPMPGTRCVSSTTESPPTSAIPSPSAISGSSPPCSTRPRRPPEPSPRPTTSGGNRRTATRNSRPDCVAPGSSCARSHPTSSIRRSTPCSSPTKPSAP